MLGFLLCVSPAELLLQIIILHIIIFMNWEIIERVKIETHADFLRTNQVILIIL